VDREISSEEQKYRFAAQSHIGASPLRVLLEDRSRSEVLRTSAGLEMVLGVVADGIGGEIAGERAAEITVNTIFDACSRSNETNVPEMLKQALEEANAHVFVESRRSRRKMNMGSTAAVAAIVEGRLYIANVGDSRIFLIRGNQVKKITMDHTWINEVIRSGLLTKEEAAKHPRREEIVRSIGYEESLKVDLGIWLQGGAESEAEASGAQGIALQKGDRVLICSDGVTKSRHDNPENHYVEEEEFPELITDRSPEQAVEAILKLARSRKVDDNISAVILEVVGKQPKPWAKVRVRTLALVAFLLVLIVGGVWFVPQWLKDKPDPPIPTAELHPGMAYLSELEGFAEKQTLGGKFMGLQLEEILTFGPGVRVRTIGEEAALRFDLADQTAIYLGPNSQVELRAIADGNSLFETLIVLEQGLVLISKTEGLDSEFIVASPIGVQARATDTLMGVRFEVNTQRFHVDCFFESCTVEGPSTHILKRGEHIWMDSNGEVSAVDEVTYELYGFGGGLVPMPTVIVQPTVLKLTSTSTSTLGPLYVPPTLTFTPKPTKTPVPPPTYTPTYTQSPTKTLKPTNTPEPTNTSEPTNTPEPGGIFDTPWSLR